MKEKAERDHREQIEYAMEQGYSKGMDKMAPLCKYLVNDGKLADIPMIMADKNLRNQMLDKYHI